MAIEYFIQNLFQNFTSLYLTSMIHKVVFLPIHINNLSTQLNNVFTFNFLYLHRQIEYFCRFTVEALIEKKRTCKTREGDKHAKGFIHLAPRKSPKLRTIFFSFSSNNYRLHNGYAVHHLQVILECFITNI